MRLTLRTLLAYLDDILPPAETKQLGEKIAATPAASQLVDRIRDVMRRRRLTAPEPDGSGGGIEPNLVAEYLDNSLSPERVADVERVCLESDVNLAEAAACHQILTLVLGEPVEITGRLRERMYALGPQGTPVEVPESASPSRRVGETNAREQLAAIKAAQRPKTKPAAKPLQSRLPEYLRRKPLWKRLFPWAAIAAVIAVWLGLLYGDPDLFGRGDDADGARVAKDETPDAEAPISDAQAKRRPADARPRPEPADAVVAATALPELPIDPPPPADDQPLLGEITPDSGLRQPGDSVATTDEAPEPAGPPTTVQGVAAVAAADATSIEPANLGPPAVEILSTNGTVLRLDSQSNVWFPLAPDEKPPLGSTIAVPEPFEAQLTIDNLELRVAALGGTRFVPFGQSDAAAVGLDVAQGRLRFTGDSADAAAIAQVMFALRLGQGLWRIEPLTVDTVFGIEVLPLQPTAVEQDLSDRTPQGVVYVAKGAVRVADATRRVEVASAGNRLILTPAGSGGIGTRAADIGVVAVESTEVVPVEGADIDPEPASSEATADIGSEPEAVPADATPIDSTPIDSTSVDAGDPPAIIATELPGIPDWLTPREPTSAARRAMVAFQKEFIVGAPVGQSLLPAVDSPYFYVAEPAAKAIGLIEDVDGMVKAIREAEHEEAILATIDGLRNWLGRSPAHGEPLRQKLEQVFAREGLAAILYDLLWGYGPEDARDEGTARQLVEWLDHPEPVVRELAFYHLKRLSGRTMYYRPLQSAGQRAGAVNRWKDFVSRNGGLVPAP